MTETKPWTIEKELWVENRLGLHARPVTLDTAALGALLAGSATLAGYFWKQFNAYKNRRLRFMQTLTENLYFKNLDNNAGVFHRLVDDAEEEESKEAILAYHSLLTSDRPLTRTELDGRIEQWFRDKWQCELNFEIGAITPPVIIKKSLLPEPCNPAMIQNSPARTLQSTPSTTGSPMSCNEPTAMSCISITTAASSRWLAQEER